MAMALMKCIATKYGQVGTGNIIINDDITSINPYGL
jgi:hypothetical protein